MLNHRSLRAIPPAIRVDRLVKTWPGGVEAVRGIDFTVAPGEVFGLLGPNGAGKSTTVGMLTTTVLPTAGRAELRGHDVAVEPRSRRARSAPSCSRTPWSTRPAPDGAISRRTPGCGASSPAPRSTASPTRCSTSGSSDILDRPVSTYSGGQRRRLEIARALVSEPEVLFLDEPTVGLDPRVRFELLDLIGGLRDRTGTTVLLTTHYLDEAERLCDRVGIMHAGRIVALDTPDQLLAELGDRGARAARDG